MAAFGRAPLATLGSKATQSESSKTPTVIQSPRLGVRSTPPFRGTIIQLALPLPRVYHIRIAFPVGFCSINLWPCNSLPFSSLPSPSPSLINPS